MPAGDADRDKAVSHISQAYPDRVEVRGRDLCGDLMGRLSFTEYFHLLLTGREPTDDQRFFLDVLLVAIAEHGLMPSNIAARMTLAADPESLQGAVAAGILGAGPVVLGTSESCARLLEEAQKEVAAGGGPATVAGDVARAISLGGREGAGVRPSGSPSARSSRRADPRARRLARRERAARSARARAARGGRGGLGEAAHDERRDADRRGDARPGLLVRRREVRSDSRAHGRAARAPRRGAGAAARLPAGRDRRRRRSSTSPMLAPDVESRPWAEQLAVDDASYRTQLAYLFDRSDFYREKLTAAGFDSDGSRGRARGDRAAAAHREARAPRDVHARQPDRRASLRDADRDRPDLLHERHDGSAELRPAHGRRPRQLGDRLGAKLRSLRRGGRASASSRRTTPVRSWRARRSPRSSASGSRTFRWGPGTPSG